MTRTKTTPLRSRFAALALAALALGEPVRASPPAQEGAPPEPPVQAPEVPEVSAREASLIELLGAQARAREELRELQQLLQTEEALGREGQIQAEIQALSAEIEGYRRDFRGISARVDVEALERAGETSTSLTDELEELLKPLMSELKRATSRPRELDRLRAAIENAKEQRKAIAEALASVEELLGATGNAELRAQLEAEREHWRGRERDALTAQSIARQRLDQQLSSQVSPGEALSRFFDVFLRDRGFKLFLALASMLAFFFLLNRVHRLVTRKGKRRRQLRLFNILYLFGRLIGGVVVFVLVLYLFGDWVLLILVILLILGVFWASKDAVPKFWSQGMLLLDTGPVREHERVIHEGLPWRVGSINFYTELVNPALSGGRIRLPISDLSELRSRSAGAEEPWFPTNNGDWIVLSDGTFGEVLLQTQEQVRVRQLGGAVRVYPTADFVAATPLALSGGFRLNTRVEIDYAYRPIAAREVPEKVAAWVQRALAESRWKEHVVRCTAEYEAAAASALVVLLQVDFAGEVARDYNVLSRRLARWCLEVCNEEGWEIPFTQITLHRGDGGADAG